MATYRYRVKFQLDEDGVIHVICPALEHAITFGDTYEAAIEHAKDLMALIVECRLADGEPIPECETGHASVEFEL